jgi:hypothetical protein
LLGVDGNGRAALVGLQRLARFELGRQHFQVCVGGIGAASMALDDAVAERCFRSFQVEDGEASAALLGKLAEHRSLLPLEECGVYDHRTAAAHDHSGQVG